MTADEKADLLARLDKAEAELWRKADCAASIARGHATGYWRIRDEAEGVALAASYVREIEVTE